MSFIIGPMYFQACLLLACWHQPRSFQYLAHRGLITPVLRKHKGSESSKAFLLDLHPLKVLASPAMYLSCEGALIPMIYLPNLQNVVIGPSLCEVSTRTAAFHHSHINASSSRTEQLFVYTILGQKYASPPHV